MKGYMKVTGVGKVKAVPDTALINLGVITENVSLERARRDNAARTAAVVKLLDTMGITSKQISTASYVIEPIYDFIDGRQVFKGYRVTNILTVTVTNIAAIGEVIDKSTSAGANRVDNVSFTLFNPSEFYNKALKLALDDALQKGSEIGKAIGVDVHEVPYRIIEQTAAAVPYDAQMAKLSAPVTPILPGQLDITASVVVILAYKE